MSAGELQAEVERVLALSELRGGYKGMDLDDLYIPVTESGCWIWIGCTNRRGYGFVYDPSAKKTFKAHRQFYRRKHGEISPGLVVCHKCDTPSCVNPDHLYAGTQLENINDMVSRNRVKGERHNNAKLTNEKIFQIREMRKTLSGVKVAAHFGINRSTVAKIIRGERWTHI